MSAADGMVCASSADESYRKIPACGFGNFAAHAADRTKGYSAVGQAVIARWIVNRLGTGIVHIFMDMAIPEMESALEATP